MNQVTYDDVIHQMLLEESFHTTIHSEIGTIYRYEIYYLILVYREKEKNHFQKKAQNFDNLQFFMGNAHFIQNTLG